jgi:hypothetical protein
VDLALFDYRGVDNVYSVYDIDQTDDYVVWAGLAGLTKVHK